MNKLILPLLLLLPVLGFGQSLNEVSEVTSETSPTPAPAAETPSESKLKFTSDFRFRIEQDWNSKKSDGSYRDDRSRMVYRFRLGASYQYNPWASFGARIRTGNLNDQQGPHVTLGGSGGEFSTVQLGFEKLYFQYKQRGLSAWVGKNTFPFEKQNELFWNDNVFPEGVSVSYNISSKTKLFNWLTLNGSHFIISSNNKSLAKDAYVQGIQFLSKHWKKKLTFFPSLYYFRNIANVPDNKGTYTQSYTIFHLGTYATISQSPRIEIGGDYYQNLQDYDANEFIPVAFKDEKTGWVVKVKLGQLRTKGDWELQLYYAHLQKYAIVDYFAQNDWARWDYSAGNATGSRLSNFHGAEMRIGYAFGKNFNLILRNYLVEQLVATGPSKENGNRIRLDLNIGF